MESSQKEPTIKEAFNIRRSVRNFATGWSDENKSNIESIINEVNQLQPPFGTDASLQIHGPGLGRMGFVSNEAGWILLKVPQSKKNSPEYKNYLIDAAFKAQIAVLKLIQKGISTVWIGGTYQEAEAEKSTPGFEVPCTVAFGVDANQKRIFDHVIGFFGSSRSRMKFEQLFFSTKEAVVFNEKSLNETYKNYKDIFECLRSSPSAMNRQPWRFNVIEESDKTKFILFDYSQTSYSAFDMGIILGGAYFYTGGKVVYDINKENQEKKNKLGELICSFTIENNNL